MPDSLLLRFRDIVADTVKQHNQIVEKKGYVYWGWWKKPLEPMPDPGLTLFQIELREGLIKQKGGQGRAENSDVARPRDERPGSASQWLLLVNSANRSLFRAPLYDLEYAPGDQPIPAPEPDASPDYYPEKLLPAWFRIGKVEEVGLDYLRNFVWSHRNRTTSRQNDRTALPPSAIGQFVLDPERDFLDHNISLWFVTPEEEIEIRQRSDVIKPLSSGFYPARGRYALHLSDLHFGSNHAFRNQLVKQRGKFTGRESMFEALLQDLKAIGIDNQIAMVLVTGDLTWSGESHEFANAMSFFSNLCEELGIHSSQIVVVPGNHDIEWRDEKDKKEVDENAELNYYNFCKNLYVASPDDSFLRVHRFEVNGRAITIIGLNSCRIESKENAGLGFVGREQLWRALKFLNEINLSTHDSPQYRRKQELRIALVHHHLIPVSYIEGIDWDTKKSSIMLDAEAVLRDLMFADVRMILHGHQHQPFFSEVRRIIHRYVDPFKGEERPLDKRIAIIGGGSIGVKRGHLNVVGRNAYNILDLGSDREEISVRTRLQSPVGPGFSDYHKTDFDI
jgi:predicted MPP superfamily phosphohydrolase